MHPDAMAQGGADMVAFGLQWARANTAWPEWANVLVILLTTGVAVWWGGISPTHPHEFVAAGLGTLQQAGAAAWVASALSHLPISSKLVPKYNSK